MAANFDVPFYANTPDDTHCFQAALKMVLKYFQPDQDYSWSTLDEMTAKQENKWTWPMAGLCWMHENGFDVIHRAIFDYALLARQKKQYLIDLYGEEVAEAQVSHSDFENELLRAKEYARKVAVDQHLPSVENIQSLLNKGYLVIVNVNARSLASHDGYVAHFVVVKGYDDKQIFLHDPGNPPRQNYKVSYEQFNQGWEFPNKDSRNLIALKPKT